MTSFFVRLPSGRYINIDTINAPAVDSLDMMDKMHLGALFRAPIMLETFIGTDQDAVTAVANAQIDANDFLESLEPWLIIRIETHTSHTANGYLHVINVHYRKPDIFEFQDFVMGDTSNAD